MKDVDQHTRISWKRILVFMLIATPISNIFRFNIFDHRSELEIVPTWMSILMKSILEGSGVIIGALITLSLLRKERKTEMTLFGTSISKSLIMAIIPITFLTVVGVENKYGLNLHFYGFIAIIGTLLYCIMEEYGWRGYLQEELKIVKPWKRYLITASMWYLWHLPFLGQGATVGNNFSFFFMMIFASWGIGQVATVTKSILASACFHLIVQIMMYNQNFKNEITGTEKLIILGISLLLFFVIIKKWEKENKVAINKE